MPLYIREIRLGLDEEEDELLPKAAQRIQIRKEQIVKYKIVRQSIDARDKGDIHFKYGVALYLADAREEICISQRTGAEYLKEEYPAEIPAGQTPLYKRPVIAGAGPAGLFCAYLLSVYGFSPLLIERGKGTDERISDFEALNEKGVLDPESNVCFGEGGAGAFSDGKLTTRIKDARAGTVLKLLIKAGAPEDILYAAKPHMGTENIRQAVKALRGMIEENGGDVRFNTCLSDLTIAEGALATVTFRSAGHMEEEAADILVLATGHSSRDTYALLKEKGVALHKKPFAVGLRIEHPRELIDASQYGRFFAHPRLGAAEYRMTSRSGNRGVYTFCMCPGGLVINASSEEGHTAVNGMSYYKRDLENSNSAIVVTVGTDDIPGDELAGVEFQRRWEKACHAAAGGYGAPCQRTEDFLKGRKTKSFGIVQPTIKPCAAAADINECLPGFVLQGLKSGIEDFSRKLKGFNMPDAVLTGAETRTSAPVTIPRGDSLEAVGVKGLYPAGEGGGHAGGIVSAAVDGLKVAEAIIGKYKPHYY